MSRLLILFFVFFSINVFAGWIEEKDGKTIINVKVWQLPDPAYTAVSNQADVAAIKLFRERFPEIFAEKYREKYKQNPDKYGRYNWNNVEIRLHKASGIEVEGVETDLLQIAGGIAPDVLYVNFRKSDNYISSGFLYPLDKLEDNYLTGMSAEEIALRINPKIWPVIKRKGPNGEVHVWALPYGGALGRVLVYRKDLFDSAGIKYPDKDWTWEDMITACRKLTRPSEGIYGLMLGRGKHESWFWVTFLWSAGGEVMEYDEKTDQWRCTFDSIEAAKALDFYTRLSAEKWIDENGKTQFGYAYKDQEGYIKWDRGQIAMRFEYVDEKLLSTINPDITGMAPVPLGPGGNRGAELNSRMMGLFSQIEHPAVRDAAWEFIKFYDGKEALALKTKVMVEGGLGKFINPKYLQMFGYPELTRLTPKGWLETFDIAIQTGKPEPYGKNSNVAYDMMTIPMLEAEQMMLAQKLPDDPEQRLKVMHELLKKACARANEKMLGIITPEQKKFRRSFASVVFLIIFITFVLVFKRIYQIFTPQTHVEGARPKQHLKRYMWAYILLVPAVATIFTWQYIPLFRGSIMALYDYKLLLKSTFVGIDNFANVLVDTDWWNCVWNSLRYSFTVVGLTFLPPIILAILLQEVPQFKIFFRTIYYLPAVISGMVVILLWKQFYAPDERGALNMIVMNVPAIVFLLIGIILFVIGLAFSKRLLIHEMKTQSFLFAFAGFILMLGAFAMTRPVFFPYNEPFFVSLTKIPFRLFNTYSTPFRWLSMPETAMLSCVIPMVWAGMGPGCLIYLAALKGIPDDLYEAADIDGASFIDKILFIVFPNLKALMIINFIGVFISSWYSGGGNILMMTGGGANTEVADLHIWYKAFTYLQFGPATAMAWMLGCLLIGFTVHQLKILSRLEFKASGAREK